ncbi:uncharacterized protein [Cicer arietinum]|uniref:Uncharacterized protein LOC101508048 isoform X1 n=1 Tax=Cicer arietinum TaxID=3827 RepID=A0A1S2Y9U5_CICAR|nr:uncharacterized protein LOC101508048 isoform X1 [Cicer arietinum]
MMKKRGAAKRHNNNKQQQSQSPSSPAQIGLKDIIGGDLVEIKDKSKKEKVKSLSAVSKALSTYQMACHDSHQPNANANKFKLPTKVFNECNGVDHASVPRKIRSAMKKRGRESTLTDSEKLNHKFHGIESLQKDRIKKSKKQVVLGPITKDEEEVAETLYALAGMFVESELNCESMPKKNASVLQDQEENTTSGALENANLIPESSLTGEAKFSSFSETIGDDEQTNIPGTADSLVPTQNTTPKINLQGMPMMVKRSEKYDGKVEWNDSGLCLEMGLNVSTQSKISHVRGKLDAEYQSATGIDCKQEQSITMYQRENGPALWPGLTPSTSVAINASYAQSSAAAKAPHWLNAAICNSKQDLMESCSSGGNITEAVIPKKSWKKCAAHVYISQLIQSLEVSNRQVAKKPELYECQQIKVHQGSKCGVLIQAQDSNATRNGNDYAAGTVHSASLDNSPETKNGILQQKCNYLDISQSQAPPLPTIYGPQKQSFNFLSLSAGGNGLNIEGCFNKGVSRLEPFSKSLVPYFRSIQQQHSLMPMPTTSSQYSSTSYLDQLPAAGPQIQPQQPHYYGSPLCGTHYSSTFSYKQHYQNFWAAQLVAAQGGSAVNCNTMMRAQYPHLQSGRHETSAMNSGARVMLPHHSISEQQPLTLASSIGPSRTNGESRGRFHGSSALSLQLLCDERI